MIKFGIFLSNFFLNQTTLKTINAVVVLIIIVVGNLKKNCRYYSILSTASSALVLKNVFYAIKQAFYAKFYTYCVCKSTNNLLAIPKPNRNWNIEFSKVDEIWNFPFLAFVLNQFTLKTINVVVVSIIIIKTEFNSVHFKCTFIEKCVLCNKTSIIR